MIGQIDSTQNDRQPGPWWLGLVASLLIAIGVSSTAMGQQARPIGPDPIPVRDSEVKPVTGGSPVAEEPNPLPVAKEAPGGAPPGAGQSGGDPSEAFGPLSTDRMATGPQKVQLSIEVKASPVINLGKESTVKLIVVNESTADAYGITVDYHLPDGLKFVSGTPEGTQDPVDKTRYWWRKPMLAANGDWTIVLKVVATTAKPCEHVATVTARAGSKMSTMIQEPKLKVEATVSPGRVLKGSPVTFQITVVNPGSGPARNVVVQAKLSSGLKSGNDETVEQVIDVLKPGERYTLDDLRVDTIAGGLQTCTVDVRSPDVNADPETARVIRNVEVTKPDLAVKLTGQDARFTGQDIDYKVTVTNTGSAPAKKVRLVATLPSQGGRTKSGSVSGKYQFIPTGRKLAWSIEQIEPGQSVEQTFVYETNAPALYQTFAEATSGELHPTDQMSTNVSGIAVLEMQISQPPIKVIDVGKTTEYDITIKNTGTKEATKLLVRGQLTNLKILKHYNVDGKFSFNMDTGEFVFPIIDRLAPGATLTLSLDVEATKSGPAGAEVSLAFSEDEEGKVKDSIATKVTPSGRTVK